MKNAFAVPLLSSVILSVSLVGCSNTLAPEYHRPAAPIGHTWPESARIVETPLPSSEPDLHWTDMIIDPNLRQVIKLALENNRDLRIAALNIEKARALYQIQRSEVTPDFGVGVSSDSGRVPASISSNGHTYTSRTYEVGVGVTAWELDFFGRIRSLKNQALHDFMATEATQRAAKIAIIAQSATAYLQFAADIEQLRIARETAISRQEAFGLQRQLQKTGTASEVELQQAQAELDAAQDDVLVRESSVAIDRNALNQILGVDIPGELLPSQPLESMLVVGDLPAGLPSDLLQERPDVLAAEQTLMGANANIGAARAAFFPSISLTGSFGRASDSLNDLFSGANRTWSVLPQVNIPIFTGGRLKAGLKASEVERDIALSNYENSIQAAFRDVADALVVKSRIDGRLAAQQSRVEAAGQAYSLVKKRYDSGVTSYLEVLDIQRSLYAAQQTWISTRLAKQTNLITLFKALGGDWCPSLVKGQVAKSKENHHS